MQRVIVITGASRGIGKAVALKLAENGEYLMLAARNYSELNQVARKCGRDTFAFTTDVTRRQDISRLFEETMRTFGRIDVWINNAGVGIYRRVLELTDDDINQMIDLNLKSALYGMQVVTPYFISQGSGHIINISSALSRVPWVSERSAYSAAKAALNNLTANLRMDLKKIAPDVNVSLVLPGAVATEFSASALHVDLDQPLSPNRQAVEEVVEVIVKLIEKPEAEVYTDPDQRKRMVDYFSDIEAFERKLNIEED